MARHFGPVYRDAADAERRSLAVGGGDPDGRRHHDADMSISRVRALPPAGGVIVNLSTNNTAATVPATVTIPGRRPRRQLPDPDQPVATATTVTITARHGVTTQWPIKLMPGSPPTSFFVRPMSTTSGLRAWSRRTEGGLRPVMQVTSSNPALAPSPIRHRVRRQRRRLLRHRHRPVTARSHRDDLGLRRRCDLSAPLTCTLPARARGDHVAPPVWSAVHRDRHSHAGGAAPVGGVVNLSSQLPGTPACRRASRSPPGRPAPPSP